MVDHFSSQFKAMAERLAAEKPPIWDGMREALIYLREFRRAAVAPDVRWGITQSAHGSDCGELRWPDPELQSAHPSDAWRGLFVAHPDDEWYVFTILGNKAQGGNRWYDAAVRDSDELVASAITSLRLTPMRRA